jgi:F-type H+-transporting ATPase subunit b
LLDEYHEQGEREKERIIEEAKQQVEKLREDAERTIEQETRKAIADLERQAVDLAVEMAEDVVRERLDDDTQSALIDRYVSEISEVGAGADSAVVHKTDNADTDADASRVAG